MSGYYNGYSSRERNAKYRQLIKAIQEGEFPPSTGPCEICSDPDVPTEYHSEDYSFPYDFVEYSLCRACHRTWFHKRFSKPFAWEAFKAHVKRGGYASDTKKYKIKKQILNYQKALESGDEMTLPYLRDRIFTGDEWWAHVSLDPESLEAFDARTRAADDILIALEKVMLELSERQKNILITHYQMPDKTSSMAGLAKALGYPSGVSLNFQYGSLAKLFLKGVRYDPPIRSNGTKKLMLVLCHASKRKSPSGEFQWVLNKSLSRALEKTALV